MRGDIRELSEKVDECRVRISELRSEQKTVEDEFQAQDYLYRKHVSEKRAEQRRRTELERAEAARVEEAEIAEIRATCEPLLCERQVCSALILYCDHLSGGSNVSTPSEPSSLSDHTSNGGSFLALPLSGVNRRRSSGFSAYSGASSHYATPLGCTPCTTPMSDSPPVSLDADKPGFYKKKDDDVFFAGAKKTKKRNRSERRLSFKKGLNHNPETFKQFASLGLEPPSSLAQIEETIVKLKEKLNTFELKAAEIKLARLGIHENGNHENNSNSGVPDIVVNDGDLPKFVIDTIDEVDKNSISPTGSLKREHLKLDLNLTNIPQITVEDTQDDENTTFAATTTDTLETDLINIVATNNEDLESSPQDCDSSNNSQDTLDTLDKLKSSNFSIVPSIGNTSTSSLEL